MNISAFDIAQRFVGMTEIPGTPSNPAILAMLKLDQSWPADDETAWCSAFVNYVAWLLRLPRSKSLQARSWLTVGRPVKLENATAGFCVVVFSRGEGIQPGPDVVNAPGHVGFFAGLDLIKQQVLVLGGNQGNSVNVSRFPISRVLGVRDLSPVLT